MVQRWKFEDPYVVEEYLFPYNPDEMGSLHPDKNVTVRTTTAVGGKSLLFEGNFAPTEWTFSGPILDPDHYAALLKWSEKRHRVKLTDHFGRTFFVYLRQYEATPQRRNNRYWYHRYTMRALILSKPTAPTVEV